MREEQINKLNQLDRIEYKLDHAALEENTFSFIFYTANITMAITAFSMLVLLITSGTINEGLGLNIFTSLISAALKILIAGLVVEIVCTLLHLYARRKLNRKYFNVESKRRRK